MERFITEAGLLKMGFKIERRGDDVEVLVNERGEECPIKFTNLADYLRKNDLMTPAYAAQLSLNPRLQEAMVVS